MVLQVVLRVSCICFLLFNIAAGFPPKKSQSGGSGFYTGGSGFMGGSGSGSGSGFLGSGSGSSGFLSGGSGFYTGSGFMGGSGSGSGSGFLGSGSGSSGFLSGGSGSSGSGLQGLAIGDVITEIQNMKPDREIPRFAWTSNHVAMGTVAERPVYPSSHVVHYNSGYGRQRSSRRDSKYVKDTFGHIPLPETQQQEGPSKTGPKGQKFY